MDRDRRCSWFEEHKKTLTLGAIATLALALVGGFLFFFFRRKRKKKAAGKH